MRFQAANRTYNYNGASDSRTSNLMMDDFGQTDDLLFLLSILKTGQTQLN